MLRRGRLRVVTVKASVEDRKFNPRLVQADGSPEPAGRGESSGGFAPRGAKGGQKRDGGGVKPNPPRGQPAKRVKQKY